MSLRTTSGKQSSVGEESAPLLYRVVSHVPYVVVDASSLD
jgi:hypothetical protein